MRTHLEKTLLEDIRKNSIGLTLSRLQFKSRLSFAFEGKKAKKKRVLLESLPYVVKHTLFLDNSMVSKMRELSDIGQLFFITDDTKIKGNRAYD